MDTPNFKAKCYQTKDDKRHNTIWYQCGLESPEDREERLKNLRESRGTWVYDEKQKKVVRKEDLVTEESKAPGVSIWDPEWAVCATGRRMSKGELKRYCREHGKVWENA